MKQSYAFLGIIIALGIGFFTGNMFSGTKIDSSALGATAVTANTVKKTPINQVIGDMNKNVPVLVLDQSGNLTEARIGGMVTVLIKGDTAVGGDCTVEVSGATGFGSSKLNGSHKGKGDGKGGCVINKN